jgi:Domain of unknown function (DUF4410)
MRTSALFACVIALPVAACTTMGTKGTPAPLSQPAFPYPQAIYVYDFAVAPTEVTTSGSVPTQLSGAKDDPNQNEKRNAVERQVAGELASKLAAELVEMGLPAVRWRGTVPKNEDAYAIVGQFLTLDDSTQPGQAIVGFGTSGTELKVLVQAYRVDGGRRALLGEAEVGAADTAEPGIAGKLSSSGKPAGSSVSTGIGLVTKVNAKLKAGAEETAEAIVERLKPSMQAQGWM